MIHKSTLVLFAAVAALGMVSSAQARSSQRPFAARHAHVHVARHLRGLRDYDPIPRQPYFVPVPSQSDSNSDFPALRMDHEDF